MPPTRGIADLCSLRVRSGWSRAPQTRAMFRTSGVVTSAIRNAAIPMKTSEYMRTFAPACWPATDKVQEAFQGERTYDASCVLIRQFLAGRRSLKLDLHSRR